MTGQNEYTMSEILPWVKAILENREITVPKECLTDYQKLCRTIHFCRN